MNKEKGYSGWQTFDRGDRGIRYAPSNALPRNRATGQDWEMAETSKRTRELKPLGILRERTQVAS